eukprot:scaffold181895_cov21-Tisochrysis_lutea.AAC.2
MYSTECTLPSAKSGQEVCLYTSIFRFLAHVFWARWLRALAQAIVPQAKELGLEADRLPTEHALRNGAVHLHCTSSLCGDTCLPTHTGCKELGLEADWLSTEQCAER